MKTRTESRQMMACLAASSRYRVIQTLALGAQCGTEVARQIGRSQSCTTRHLQALKRGGMVRGVRRGKRVVFSLRLDDERVRTLVEWALEQRLESAEAAPGDAAGLRTGMAGNGKRSPMKAPAARTARAGNGVGARRKGQAGEGTPGGSARGAPGSEPASAGAQAPPGRWPEDASPAADPVPERGAPVFDDLEDFLL